MLSAEGAISTSAWGVTPGIQLQLQQALKARLNQPPIIELVSKVNRAFSADGFLVSQILGRCPRLAMRRGVGGKHLPSTDGLAFGVEHALRDFKLA